ncbi:hypothetical protein HNR26_000010 [Rhizobium rosettiformans]|uniref:Uncharacterized protein n=2 Tax=Rhizobium rosettiformans TaxID=1368430 RepID=A0A4S8Q2N5_9HYPH|nr:hypothetical protein [Rhizobium rosettiformans]MBB5273972.1 hypothetical protein [Rhizobium rosettiformans]THV38358.1 hypothetical protein FAA86_06105 [Rhizobium rosettiformans W3]
MKTYTRAEAQNIAGHHADEIVRRMFPSKPHLSAGEVAAIAVAAELRSQDIPLPHACRAASIISEDARGCDVRMTLEQLYTLSPSGKSGKHTRELTLPPPDERHRRISISLGNIRRKIGGAI